MIAITPRDIIKKQLGETDFLIDCKEMEVDFAKHLVSHVGIKIETATLYIGREMTDAVAIAMQKFIFDKTGVIVLVDNIKKYKYILVKKIAENPTYLVKELSSNVLA